MHEHQLLWDRLYERLSSLKPAFSGNHSEDRLDRFNEYLSANEFDLALHILCDYLIEHAPKSLNPRLVADISELHSMMELEDECGAMLERAIRHCPSK